MDAGTAPPVPAGRRHAQEVTPQTADAIYLAWTNGASRELRRSLLNLLLIQHEQELKWTPSYTSANRRGTAPLFSVPLPS